MSRRTRKITALLSATALLGGAGLGVADAAKTSTGSRTANAAPDGHRGRGPMPASVLARIASALGVSSADLKAALDANRPARPAGGDKRGDFAADLASALGVETSAVQSILEANRPARPDSPPADGARPPRPDRSKLVTALASGLKLDESAVTAALDKLEASHEADHQAHEAALYAALAKALNKTAAEVKAAFEANCPAPPAR